MLKNLKKKLKNNKGFTILELIVVIAIMGFLVALIAPRLAGVTESSKKPIADTNLQRLSEIVQRNVEQTGKLPNLLDNISLGSINHAGGSIGAYDPVDSTNAGTYSRNFVMGNNMKQHTLTESEAKEIKSLGITKIMVMDNSSKEVVETEVAEGIEVLMIGAYGIEGKFFTPTPGTGYHWYQNTSARRTEADSTGTGHMTVGGSRYIRPELIYRIVLGIGGDSELVKEGLMKDIGKHPEYTKYKDKVKVTEYAIVLPRLKATLQNFKTNDAPAGASTPQAKLIKEITVNGYSEHLLGTTVSGTTGGKKYDNIWTNGATEQDSKDAFKDKFKPVITGRKISLEAQDISEVAIISTLGDERYPANSNAAEWEIVDVEYVNP